MATSPVVLLDAVSEVGAGSIIALGTTLIRPVMWRIEPSADAQIESNLSVGNAVLVEFSLDPEFPSPTPPHLANQRTGVVANLTFEVSNPVGDPGPQPLLLSSSYDVFGVPLGSAVEFPYMRATLNVPLVQGTVTVEFYFENIVGA